MSFTSQHRGLTGAVGVDHQTLVDVVLDEQQRLLKDLAGPGLLHGVGVPGVPEESQQLSWGARLTGGRRGGGEWVRRGRGGRGWGWGVVEREKEAVNVGLTCGENKHVKKSRA